MLATTNAGKAREIGAILAAAGLDLECVPRPADVAPVEETGATLEENARLKARAVRDATGEAAIADDTGLEVDVLGGAPGVHAARFAGPDASDDENVARLLARLDGVPLEARRARFVTVAVAVFPDGRELAAIGTAEGAITSARRGAHGFGYDPVFLPDAGDGRTFAELSPAEKDACSHRGAAFRTLGEGLRILDQAGHLDPPPSGDGPDRHEEV